MKNNELTLEVKRENNGGKSSSYLVTKLLYFCNDV